MKKTVTVLKAAVCAFALVGVVLFAACGSGGGKSALVGQWVEVNSKSGNSSEMELFSDGTAAFKDDDMSVNGTWNIVDKRFVTIANVLGTSMTQAADYKVSGYELTLISNDGDTARFVKKEKLEEFKAKQVADKKRAVEQSPTITDDRDGKVYKKVAIGTQIWMAENLNYAAEGSKCYGEGGPVVTGYDERSSRLIGKTLTNEEMQANCTQYGRLYNWATAQKACPTGWHLPTVAEWKMLVDYVGGKDVAGAKLKSTSGWEKNGTDEYEFSALPGGSCHNNGNFSNIGEHGNWWSATEDKSGNAYIGEMGGFSENGVSGFSYGRNKRFLFSVRCVQN